jgi:hypothetical protein
MNPPTDEARRNRKSTACKRAGVFAALHPSSIPLQIRSSTFLEAIYPQDSTIALFA